MPISLMNIWYVCMHVLLRFVMTESGRHVWMGLAQPKIKAYCEQALQDFSMGDMAHTLHYFLKPLDNMEKIDQKIPESEEDDGHNAVAEL